jgi:hypothetical protein
MLESIPGLLEDLNRFIGEETPVEFDFGLDDRYSFRMDEYREHILSALGWSAILFSNIVPFMEDCRRDRIWRFITLIYMENDGEIELTQNGTQIWVQRVYDEAYYEGQGFPGAVESAL